MPDYFSHLDAPQPNRQSGIVQIAPGDPKLPGAIAGQGLDNRAKALDIARTPIQMQGDRLANAQAAATMPYSVRKARADAISAENKAVSDAALARDQRLGLTPETKAALHEKLTTIGMLENNLKDLEEQYRKNFKGRPISRLGGFTEYAPGWANGDVQKFDKAAQQVGPYIMSILGLSGKSTDAAAEYKQKVVPFIPSASEQDGTTEQTLARLRMMINSQKAGAYKALGIKYKTRPVANGSSGSANAGSKGDDIDALVNQYANPKGR